ncbi:MAG: hypothetical protein Q9222_006669 [Ikaeria aurantiellina]
MGRAAFSIILVSSYIIDWIVLIAIAGIGAAFSQIAPRKRPFDITDRAISYPLEPETVTNTVLILVTLLVPAAIVLVGSLFIPTGAKPPSSTSASLKRKLWEWNTGWMGLALAYSIAFIVTNGAKEVLGKPRPNLLARCNPDVTRQAEATAGGIGGQIEEGITMFDWRICRNTGSLLDEGFRSFPSGHSSRKLLSSGCTARRFNEETVAFAGLVYLALWLCAKLGIAIPMAGTQNTSPTSLVVKEHRDSGPLRTRAAAAPTYLILFPLVPIGAAIYISSTRYSDFWHHGFDVFVSAGLGILTAWLGFRWYHIPIRQGGGWAWAPRSPRRAYWKGPGRLAYTENQDQEAKDLEQGGIVRRETFPPPGSGRGGSYEMNDLQAAGQSPTDFIAHERS